MWSRSGVHGYLLQALHEWGDCGRPAAPGSILDTLGIVSGRMNFLARCARTVGAMLVVAAGPLAAQNYNCLPPSARGARVTSIDSLRGSTLLIAYGDAGPNKGRITSGTLDLAPAGAALRASGVLLVGTTTIDLARIGAQFTGSLRSRDPATPGVTLEGGSEGRPFTLTLGSVRLQDAQGEWRSPVTRFELVEKTTRGYRGYWRTLGASGAAGRGYFCASRF
jgi:hypothetical protein